MLLQLAKWPCLTKLHAEENVPSKHILAMRTVGRRKKNAFKIYTYGLMNIYMFVTWALPSIKKLGNSSLRHDFLIFAPFKD